MKRINKKIKAAAVAVLVATTLTLGANSPAHATYAGVDMHGACQLQYGGLYRALLLDPGNAYSWRCYLPPYTSVQHNVSINLYCAAAYSGYAVVLDPGNAYSWRCWY